MIQFCQWLNLLMKYFCFIGFVHQLAPEQGVQSMDQSTGVKRRCDEEATRVVEENNATMGLYVVKSIINNCYQSFVIIKKLFSTWFMGNLNLTSPLLHGVTHFLVFFRNAIRSQPLIQIVSSLTSLMLQIKVSFMHMTPKVLSQNKFYQTEHLSKYSTWPAYCAINDCHILIKKLLEVYT